MSTRNYAKPTRIKSKRSGKLGGSGYLSLPAKDRRVRLRKCVKSWGYRSCLGSVQALEVWGKNRFTASQLSKLASDRNWLVRTYGAEDGGESKRDSESARIARNVLNLNKEMY